MALVDIPLVPPFPSQLAPGRDRSGMDRGFGHLRSQSWHICHVRRLHDRTNHRLPRHQLLDYQEEESMNE